MEWTLKFDSGARLKITQESPTQIHMRLQVGPEHYVDTPVTVMELMNIAEVIGKFTLLGEKN